MKMALAIIFPPLGVLACGKIGQFFLNLVFCVIGVWIGGIIHAVYVVSKFDADKRHQEMLSAMGGRSMSNVPVVPEKKGIGIIGIAAVTFVILFLVGPLIAVMFFKGDASEGTMSSRSEKATTDTPKFDFSSVDDSELPPLTQLTDVTEFVIAGGSGTATAASGSQVKITGRSGMDVEVEYLGGKKMIPYTSTELESQIVSNRAAAAKQAEDNRLRDAQMKVEQDKAEKEARANRKISVYATREADGTITIENRDDFDWTSVKLYLNRNYTTDVQRIPAKSSVKIRSTDFTLKDGTRFNPISIKANSLTLTADTPLGRTPSEVRWR